MPSPRSSARIWFLTPTRLDMSRWRYVISARQARTSARGTCTCGTMSRYKSLASLAASKRSFFFLLL